MWEFQQIEPQNARGKLKEEMWNDPDWIAEEKFDGDRRVAQFCGDVIRFTGRRRSVKDGLFVEKTANIPHLSGYAIPGVNIDQPTCRPPRELEGTVLDGEMVVPPDFLTGAGGRSKHVTSIMGSLPLEAVLKQLERGFLRYAVFDCLFWKGRDLRMLTLSQRRDYMWEAMDKWQNPYAFGVTYCYEDKRAFLSQIQERAGEGIILKHVYQKYGEQFGGHLKWVKVKFSWMADVIVTGYKPAKEMSTKVTGEKSITKYHEMGWIGAINFAQWRDGEMVDVGFTSGIDEMTRAAISEAPERYLGRVLRIKHFGREPTGKFRHPQFDEWRDDKNPEDCIFDPEEK